MRHGGAGIYLSNSFQYSVPYIYLNGQWKYLKPYIYANNNWQLSNQAGTLMVYFLTNTGDYFMTNDNGYFLVRER